MTSYYLTELASATRLEALAQRVAGECLVDVSGTRVRLSDDYWRVPESVRRRVIEILKGGRRETVGEPEE